MYHWSTKQQSKIANDGTKLIKNINTVRTFNGDVVDILGQAVVF